MWCEKALCLSSFSSVPCKGRAGPGVVCEAGKQRSSPDQSLASSPQGERERWCPQTSSPQGLTASPRSNDIIYSPWCLSLGFPPTESSTESIQARLLVGKFCMAPRERDPPTLSQARGHAQALHVSLLPSWLSSPPDSCLFAYSLSPFTRTQAL